MTAFALRSKAQELLTELKVVSHDHGAYGEDKRGQGTDRHGELR
jgi:hypothetical protein